MKGFINQFPILFKSQFNLTSKSQLFKSTGSANTRGYAEVLDFFFLQNLGRNAVSKELGFSLLPRLLIHLLIDFNVLFRKFARVVTHVELGRRRTITPTLMTEVADPGPLQRVGVRLPQDGVWEIDRFESSTIALPNWLILVRHHLNLWNIAGCWHCQVRLLMQLFCTPTTILIV